MEEKRVTIKEISRALGVSPTTVTKALTGKAQVSDKKRIKCIYVTSYNFVPVCRCLVEHGRGDIAVIGHALYTGIELHLMAGPLVASIYQNPFRHGQMAVRVLYEAVTEKKRPGKVLIKPELVMRTNPACYKGDY